MTIKSLPWFTSRQSAQSPKAAPSTSTSNARPVLSPSQKPTRETPGSRWLLPTKIRSFGQIFDFDQLMVGDLILFDPIKPSLFERAIRRAQKQGGFEDSHARWTHAAVYTTNRFVVEANVSGVAYTDLCSYSQDYNLCVRRDPNLSINHRYELALQAATRIGQRYSKTAALSAGMGAIRGYWNPKGLLDGRFGATAIICSKLVSDCYITITHNSITPGELPVVVTPAHLSKTTRLQDVSVDWLRLV